MNAHLQNARDYLAKGEQFYRKAAEEIQAARTDGLTWPQIADDLERSEKWVEVVVKWAKTPANEAQYTAPPFAEAKGAVATRHTRSVLRQAEPEHLEQIVGDLPLGQLERIADATYEARKARIREQSTEPRPTVSDRSAARLFA